MWAIVLSVVASAVLGDLCLEMYDVVLFLDKVFSRKWWCRYRIHLYYTVQIFVLTGCSFTFLFAISATRKLERARAEVLEQRPRSQEPPASNALCLSRPYEDFRES